MVLEQAQIITSKTSYTRQKLHVFGFIVHVTMEERHLAEALVTVLVIEVLLQLVHINRTGYHRLYNHRNLATSC